MGRLSVGAAGKHAGCSKQPECGGRCGVRAPSSAASMRSVRGRGPSGIAHCRAPFGLRTARGSKIRVIHRPANNPHEMTVRDSWALSANGGIAVAGNPIEGKSQADGRAAGQRHRRAPAGPISAWRPEQPSSDGKTVELGVGRFTTGCSVIAHGELAAVLSPFRESGNFATCALVILLKRPVRNDCRGDGQAGRPSHHPVRGVWRLV